MTPAAVALGGNLGSPRRAFRKALAALGRAPGVAVVAASRLWRSEPWGLRDQPEFLNAAVLLETSIDPEELLRLLKRVERAAGPRPDGPRWGPRPLDLDLLFHGRAVLDGPELTLPHPGIPGRTFVLEPLAEIAPDWVHPGTGWTCAEMLAALRASGRATACHPDGEWAPVEVAGACR